MSGKAYIGMYEDADPAPRVSLPESLSPSVYTRLENGV